MKDKRVRFDMKPKVKEFYKNDIVYSNTSNDSILIYIIGAIFITYMINTYKRQERILYMIITVIIVLIIMGLLAKYLTRDIEQIIN